MNKLSKSAIAATGLVVFSQLLSLAKVSYIVGSSWGLFSFNNIFSPMVGVLATSWVGCLFYAFKLIIKSGSFCSNPMLLFALQLPLVCAAVAWNRNWFMALASCSAIILFNLQLVSASALCYSLLWLIPLAISMSRKNTFLTALGSTFTAHAVGSVAWAYFGPAMGASVWLGLIPVVLFERFMFASGMVLTYQLYNYAVSLFGKIRSKQFRAISF